MSGSQGSSGGPPASSANAPSPSGLGGGSGGGGGPHGKRGPATTILIYPTVAPETVVIPIVSCILGFPLLALLVICCLRRRAQLARERERRRAAGTCDFSDHGGLSLVRLSPVHRPGRSSRGGSGGSGHHHHRSGGMGAWGGDGGEGGGGVGGGGVGGEGGGPRRDMECGVAALVGGVLFLDTVVEERSEAEVDAELTTEVNMPSPTDEDEDSGCYQGDRGEYDSKAKKDYRHYR